MMNEFEFIHLLKNSVADPDPGLFGHTDPQEQNIDQNHKKIIISRRLLLCLKKKINMAIFCSYTI